MFCYQIPAIARPSMGLVIWHRWPTRWRPCLLQKKARFPSALRAARRGRGRLRRNAADDADCDSRRAEILSHLTDARLVDECVTAIGLRLEEYGTHSLRRTKASTRRQVVSAPSRFCVVTPRSGTLSDISASMWRTRCSLRESRSDIGRSSRRSADDRFLAPDSLLFLSLWGGKRTIGF